MTEEINNCTCFVHRQHGLSEKCGSCAELETLWRKYMLEGIK